MSFQEIRNVEAHALQTGKQMGLVGVHLADYVNKSLDRYVEIKSLDRYVEMNNSAVEKSLLSGCVETKQIPVACFKCGTMNRFIVKSNKHHKCCEKK